jgi:hypothetical protein
MARYTMKETVSGLFGADVVFRQWGRDTRESLRNWLAVSQKLDLIQDRLGGLLRRNSRDNAVMDFCIKSLKIRDGRMAVKELVQRTGCSRRYVDLRLRVPHFLSRNHVVLGRKNDG